MLRFARYARLAVVAAVFAACSAPPTDGVGASAQLTADATDPVAQLEVIASPEMDGRGTPSVGLEHAIAYVVSECTRAGLAGAADGGGFEQPFTIGGASPVSDLHGDDLTLGDPHPTIRAAGVTSNIVATIAGSGAHATEIVLLSAHLDHLGHGYPGADDDGSGSAALLAIAHRLRHSRTSLDRTVAFLWTTGEERGLLGSSYFVDHPPAAVPLARIAEVVNLDAVGALEEDRFSILPDSTRHTARAVDLLTESSRELDPPFRTINRDLDEYTRRTDAWSFVRKGVPTVWVFEGLTNPSGGGRLMPRYHRPTDTLENLLAENGGRKLRRMTDMLTRTIEKLANADFDSPR